jgi:hypothetical protein
MLVFKIDENLIFYSQKAFIKKLYRYFYIILEVNDLKKASVTIKI